MLLDSRLIQGKKKEMKNIMAMVAMIIHHN